MEKWIGINKRADFKGIGQKFNIDQVTARIIRNRDVTEEKDIEKFLNGGLEDLYDPHLLKDADKLVGLLSQMIKERKHIRIIGDYDIDGVMSTYILNKALLRCGADVSVVIPDRIADGYGLNMHLIEKAHEEGVDTIITCDNGIAAIDEIKRAKELGMSVLVTDHHAIPYENVDGECVYKKSEADAVVNPHQIDCPYPYKEICGATVAWKVVLVLYEKNNIPVAEAYDFLENVAFATVGDIMPLSDENRIIVKEGLKRIHRTGNIGMNALINQCGLEKGNIDSYHFGFVLGPCINASGRLDLAIRALKLLMTEDVAEANRIAGELVILNDERKQMTLDGVEKAVYIYDSQGYENDSVIVIYLEDTHESVAGIIAGRIKELYHKPTFILADGERTLKGSGRSIEAFSMYDEMVKCADLFEHFGGHPMAAGLSIARDNLDEFRRRINANANLTQDDFVEKVKIDVPMPMYYPTLELAREFELLAPYGNGNPRPLFMDKCVKIARMWVVGKNQNVLKLSIRTSAGTIAEGIYFGNIPGFMEYVSGKFGEQQLENAKNGRGNNIELAIVYSLKINIFRDIENLQFEIRYYK